MDEMKANELYQKLKEKYQKKVEDVRSDLNKETNVAPSRHGNANIVLAAYGSARGPFFREDEEPDIDFWGHFERCAGMRYLRPDITEAFGLYPDAYANYIQIYDASDTSSQKCLAIYATLMVQLTSELDKWLSKTPVTGAERNEYALRCFALADLHCDFRNIWSMYCTCGWSLYPHNEYCCFYFDLHEIIYRIYRECTLATIEITSKKQQKERLEEFKAAKIRGQGAILNINAMLFNDFRFGGLRECGQYYMLDFFIEWLKEFGSFDRFEAEFTACSDTTERKKLALITVALVTVKRLRNEKLTQYDGAVKSNNQKEKWETGIYIDAFNEIERGFIEVGKKYGAGGFLYE